MKNRRIAINVIVIILMSSIIFGLILIILSMKNTNIEKQVLEKQQLTTTSDNTYVSMKDHLEEVNNINVLPKFEVKEYNSSIGTSGGTPIVNFTSQSEYTKAMIIISGGNTSLAPTIKGATIINTLSSHSANIAWTSNICYIYEVSFNKNSSITVSLPNSSVAQYLHVAILYY